MFFDKLAKRCRNNIVFGSYYTVVITSVDSVRNPMVSMGTAFWYMHGHRNRSPRGTPHFTAVVV